MRPPSSVTTTSAPYEVIVIVWSSSNVSTAPSINTWLVPVMVMLPPDFSDRIVEVSSKYKLMALVPPARTTSSSACTRPRMVKVPLDASFTSLPSPRAIKSPRRIPLLPRSKLMLPSSVSKMPVTSRFTPLPAAALPVFITISVCARILPAIYKPPFGPAGAPMLMIDPSAAASIAKRRPDVALTTVPLMSFTAPGVSSLKTTPRAEPLTV